MLVRSSWFVSPPSLPILFPSFPLLPYAPFSAQCTAARLVPAATYPPVLQKNTITTLFTYLFPWRSLSWRSQLSICAITLIDGNGRIDGHFTPKYDSHTPRVSHVLFRNIPACSSEFFLPAGCWLLCVCMRQPVNCIARQSKESNRTFLSFWFQHHDRPTIELVSNVSHVHSRFLGSKPLPYTSFLFVSGILFFRLGCSTRQFHSVT